MRIYNFILASFLLSACNGGVNDSSNQTADSTNAEIAAKPAAIASPAIKDTPEKLAHEVKGPVKFLVSDEIDGLVSKFDEKGGLIYRRTGSVLCQTVLQDDGSLYMAFGGTTLYHVAGGRLDSIDGGEEGFYFCKKFNFDKDGNVKQIVYTEGSDSEEESTTKVYDVKVLDTDAHGNWLSRKEGDKVVTRKIYYYGEEDNVSLFNPESSVYHFCGKVSTMDNCFFHFGGAKEGECSLNGSTRKLKYVSYDKNSGELILEAKMNGKVVGNYVGTVTINANGSIDYKGNFKNVNLATVPFDLSSPCL